MDALITRRVIPHVDAVLGEGYTSVGAIEGALETLTIHGAPHFTVYDAVTGRAVSCYFSMDRLQDIIAALGKKVLVHGQLRRDPRGRPTQLRSIDDLRILGASQRVDPLSLAGVLKDADFNARDYLSEIRGE